MRYITGFIYFMIIHFNLDIISHFLYTLVSLTTTYFVRILETSLHSVLFWVWKVNLGKRPLFFKMIQCVLGRRILNKQTLIFDCQNYANLLIKLVLHLMGCWLRNFDIFKKYNIKSCNSGFILNKIGRYLIIYIANSFGPETSFFWRLDHYALSENSLGQRPNIP